MPSLQTPSLAKLSPSVRWLRQEVISRSAYAEIERHFGRPSRDDLLRLELCRSRHAPIGAAQSAECLGSVSAGQDQMRLVRFQPPILHPDTAFPPLRSAPEIH